MKQSLQHVMTQWLKLSGFTVAKELITSQLVLHPDYPSLKSATDLLDHLEIPNLVLQVDRNKVDELPYPLLIHQNNQSVIAQRSSELPTSDWKGLVMIMDKTHQIANEQNERLLSLEAAKNTRMRAGIIIIVACVAGLMSVEFSLVTNLILGLTILGLILTILIIQQAWGISSSISNKVCSLIKKGSCEKQSDGMADVGFIYFVSLLSIQIIVPALVFPVTILALAVIPYSVYQQWRTRRWCVLCLMVMLVVLLQAIPGIYYLETSLITVSDVLEVVMIIILMGTSWLLFKKGIMGLVNVKGKNISLERLRRKSVVFMALLSEGKKISAAAKTTAIEIGNPTAGTKIVMICSPYCAPCAMAHDVLQQKNVSLKILFSVQSGVADHPVTEAVTYIIKLLQSVAASEVKTVMHHWYQLMNLEAFKKMYPLTIETDVFNKLQEHEEIVTELGIAYTPTIFINDHEMPSQYDLGDALRVLRQQPAGEEWMMAS